MPSSETIKQKLEQARQHRDEARTKLDGSQSLVDELKAQLAQAESLEAGNERERQAKRYVLEMVQRGRFIDRPSHGSYWMGQEGECYGFATPEEIEAWQSLIRDGAICREDRVAS